MARFASSRRPVDEEVHEGTLAERLVHKNWKARQAAAVELQAVFDAAGSGDAPCFAEYAGLLPKMLKDSNAAALANAVAAATSYVHKADNAAQITESIAQPLVEKCLAAKASTRNAAETLALLLLEVDEPQSTTLLTALAAGSGNRLAKIAAPSLVCMQKALSAFGTSALAVSIVAQALPPIFQSAKDRKVRTEAVKTSVELFRWMGAALMPLLDEVRDSQKIELEKEFEKVDADETPSPTQTLRCLKDASPAEAGSGGAAGSKKKTAGGSGGSAVDLFAKEEAVLNLTKKLNVKAFLSGMGEEKWKLRKDQIDNLIEITEKADQIASGDHGDVVAALKKSLKDSNMAVVAAAIRALGLLGRGLRKDFSMHMPGLLPEFMDNYRNKNRGVVNAVDFSLDAMHLRCYIITENMDTVSEFASTKVPAARAKMFGYIERAVVSAPEKSLRKVTKQMCEMLLKGIDDKTPEARDAALQTTGALLHVLDEATLAAVMESPRMDKFKATKIRSYAAELSGESAPTEADSPRKQRKALNSAPAPKGGPSSSSSADKPSRKANSKSSSAPAAKKASAAPVKEAAVAPAMTDDELSAKIEELIPCEIVTMLSNKSFKYKVQGITDLGRMLFGEEIPPTEEGVGDEELNGLIEGMRAKVAASPENLLSGVHHIAEVVVLFFGRAIPNFKDSNFMVVTALWTLVARLAESPAGLSKYAAGLCIPAMIEKISDKKIKPAARSCLSAIAEICTPNFVYVVAYDTLKTIKSPPVHAETMGWIDSSVTEFGVDTVDVLAMITACITCLESSNAGVRKNTTALIVTMHSYVGAGLLDMLGDVKPSTRDLIDKHISLAGDVKPAEPTRAIKCDVAPMAGGAVGGELPRVDISDGITSALLLEMKDANWKTRGAALDAVDQLIVSAGKRITPDVDELPRDLAVLFGDANQSLKIKAMNLTGTMAAAMGGSPGITRHLQMLLPKMVANVSDNKSVVRDATLRNLDMVVAQVGIKAVLPFAPEAFFKPQGMSDMMTWMLKQLSAATGEETLDIAPMVEPVVKCLLDRNADVRSLAEQMLTLVVASVGIATVRASPTFRNASATASKDLANIVAKFGDDGANDGWNSTGTIAATASSVRAAAPAAKITVPKASSAPARKKKQGPTADEIETAEAEAQSVAEMSVGGPKVLLKGSNKELRQKRETKKKGGWIMDDMKMMLPEYQVELKRQLAEICDKSLLEDLFHRDFKVQIAACVQLREAMGGYQAEVASSVDLLSKYAIIKIWETNSQMHAEMIDFMGAMLDQLTANDYWMTDYEASVIMPHWVEKVGMNNPKLREGMRNCLHKFSQIFPMSKLYVFILDGLDSKNTRTRVDCIEELGGLLGGNGLTVFDPKRTVPRLAKWVGNADRTTSAAALDAMQKIFQLCDEPAAFFKLCGELSGKQRSILDGRFKHDKAAASKIAAAKKRPASSPAASATTHPASAPTGGLHNHPAPKEAAAPAPVAAPVAAPKAAWEEEDEALHVDTVTTEAEEQLQAEDFFIDMKDAELEKRVFGHKQFLSRLNKHPETVVPIANAVVIAVTRMMTETFQVEDESMEYFFRNCKYPLNTLMEMFNSKLVASTVGTAALSALVEAVVGLISQKENLPAVARRDETNCRYLMNALGGVMFRCLDNSSPTVAFLSVLTVAGKSLDSKKATLLCKCEQRISAKLKNPDKENPEGAEVMLVCHKVLSTMPMSARVDGKGEVQLRFRAIQSIVNEMSNTGLVDLSKVPAAADMGDGGVRGMLRLLADAAAMKKSAAAAEAVVAAAPVAETVAEAEAEVPLSTSGWKLPAQAKPSEMVELEAVMARLKREGCKDQETIDELREYVCRYPEADVDRVLDEGLPGYMRELVRTGLARGSHTQQPLCRTNSEVTEDEVKDEQEEVTLQGKDLLAERIAALREAAPAEAALGMKGSPLAARSVNVATPKGTPTQKAATSSKLASLQARLQAAKETNTIALEETKKVESVAVEEEVAAALPPVQNMSDIKARLARLKQAQGV